MPASQPAGQTFTGKQHLWLLRISLIRFLVEWQLCPMCQQVSDRGGERYYGSLAVLWRLALTWWNPFPAKIPPATCGRLKKNRAFPPVALVVLEPQSRTCHVSASKVKSSVHHITPLPLLIKTAFKRVRFFFSFDRDNYSHKASSRPLWHLTPDGMWIFNNFSCSHKHLSNFYSIACIICNDWYICVHASVIQFNWHGAATELVLH